MHHKLKENTRTTIKKGDHSKEENNRFTLVENTKGDCLTNNGEIAGLQKLKDTSNKSVGALLKQK